MNKEPDQIVKEAELRLVRRAAGGDRQARRELFERFRDVAFAVAVRVMGNHEDALDVVQDGFIKAFAGLAEFQGDARFKTWLLRIVNNRALDLLRRRKVRLAVSLDDGDENTPADFIADGAGPRPSDELEKQELGERITEAIKMLPPDQKSVFSLYANEEMTYGEIAEIVGVPIGTVMSRIYHARRRLRDMLADLAPGKTKREDES